MGEIILRVSKKYQCKLNGVIRVNPEAEVILQKLSDETGLSVRTIASEIIIQGEKMIQIED